ncbi:MAG: 30S ribosomal protein S5 [Candidatus Paceibacterota bacterium]|jgi:small subunit ribosomal protein S5
MTAKEIKQNNDSTAGGGAAALDINIPATGVDVAAILPESAHIADVADIPATAPTANKFTPGRKMRGDPARRGGHGSAGPGAQSRGGPRGGRGETRERVKPEFDSKIIDIRRVTRVAAGGRRYSFSVAVVAGDRKGRVGVGLGKGGDTALSVEKATREAKKNLIKITLSPQMTIPHAVEGKYGSALIKIFPARGSGIVAGSSARAVIELAGVRDVCAKFLSGSKNRLNNARAAIEAFRSLSKTSRATLRGKTPKVKEGIAPVQK